MASLCWQLLTVQYLLSLRSQRVRNSSVLSSGLQEVTWATRSGAHLKADILPAVAWNIRGPTCCNFMNLPTRPGGNWALATLPCVWHRSFLSLHALLLLSASLLWVTCSWKWFSCLSLYSVYFGICHTLRAQQAFWVWILCKLFTRKQRKAVCWQVLSCGY